jgi:hypothetical protein
MALQGCFHHHHFGRRRVHNYTDASGPIATAITGHPKKWRKNTADAGKNPGSIQGHFAERVLIKTFRCFFEKNDLERVP